MSEEDDRLKPFDFDLPERLIALRPVERRDASRLLVVRKDGTLEDHQILDLPKLLATGDTLVFNNTRVLPAALEGVRRARSEDGHDIHIQANLVEAVDDQTWRALARPGKRLHIGDQIDFGNGLTAAVDDKADAGVVTLRFNLAADALDAKLHEIGQMPLPPYIARRRPADADDLERYQTVYADGPAESVAAPTAGLHFTPELRAALAEAGVLEQFVRLRVGLGTFQPLRPEQIDAGRLHAETREVTAETAAAINRIRSDGRACIAVGTTALRTLESAATSAGVLGAVFGPTDLFIQPGYRFQIVDGLLTNFHLPRSSLFMLVSALMGTETMQAAYAHAVQKEYRFFSYGDACLLLP
ncbi:MAG: tRNA preQ1(34) S-adenosylmethionine ribosyltransferase-isomerase QueA [Pseudomonadota bacterium]